MSRKFFIFIQCPLTPAALITMPYHWLASGAGAAHSSLSQSLWATKRPARNGPTARREHKVARLAGKSKFLSILYLECKTNGKSRKTWQRCRDPTSAAERGKAKRITFDFRQLCPSHSQSYGHGRICAALHAVLPNVCKDYYRFGSVDLGNRNRFDYVIGLTKF